MLPKGFPFHQFIIIFLIDMLCKVSCCSHESMLPVSISMLLILFTHFDSKFGVFNMQLYNLNYNLLGSPFSKPNQYPIVLDFITIDKGYLPVSPYNI